MYQRQELLNLIELFTPQSLIDFYSSFFENLDLSILEDILPSKFGPKGYSRHAFLRASIDTESSFFKKIYSLRTESERYNSRFKNLNLENASVRNID